MNVEIKMLSDITEPYAIIYTNRLTEEIQKLMDIMNDSNSVVTAVGDDRTIVLNSSEIYMARVEEEKTMLYCEQRKYISRKRLCDLEKNLGYDFMKISKTTLINLKYVDEIQPAFNGMMLLILKNGCKDYISRKYLPEFKKYLGL
ncbi:MAG: LytTR family transcriptional regulator [Lachnospiraceae bacterium]|nr:LytTR family transcriptional regulator [Lachnospiraceae bacterium]MBO5144777.1 LytTR family transcriptional regulator [Lachnospiraceae bacterium]